MEPRPAHPHEIDAIRALLQECGLPTEDLESSRVGFVVAADGERLHGVGGIEAYPPHGLLRSLAVRRDRHGVGLGTHMLEALEARARAQGLSELVLLTTTAAPFFAARGYREIARTDVPAPVQASAEFRSLCPASATCMHKRLETMR